MGKFSGRKKRYSEKSHFGNTVGGEGATAGPAKPTWAWGASPGALACACGLGQASQGLARGTGRAWASASRPPPARPHAQPRARATCAVRQVRPSAPNAPKRPNAQSPYRPRPRLARPHARTHARTRARARLVVPCRSTTPAAKLARRPHPGALACTCGLGQASQGLARGTGRAWARAWWLCPAVAQPPPQSWPDGLAPMGRRGNRRPPRPHRPVRPLVPTEHPQYIDF